MRGRNRTISLKGEIDLFMKKITFTGVIITLICAVIVSAVGFAAFRYLSMDRGMIGHQPDQTGDDTYERYSNSHRV